MLNALYLHHPVSQQGQLSLWVECEHSPEDWVTERTLQIVHRHCHHWWAHQSIVSSLHQVWIVMSDSHLHNHYHLERICTVSSNFIMRGVTPIGAMSRAACNCDRDTIKCLSRSWSLSYQAVFWLMSILTDQEVWLSLLHYFKDEKWEWPCCQGHHGWSKFIQT